MKKLIIILISLAVITNSCIDVIELKTEPDPLRVSIDGFITTNDPPYTIRIRESAQYVAGGDGAQQPISNATVRVIDGDGNVLNFQEDAPGFYLSTDLSYRGQIGQTYTLEAEINGALYRSEAELMPTPLPVDSVKFTVEKEEYLNNNNVIQEREVVKVYANTTLSDQAQYLKWNVLGEYQFVEVTSQSNLSADICYIREQINFDNISIFDGSEYKNQPLYNQEVVTKNIDYRFAYRYCFHVYQTSISERAYEFWEGVKNEITRTGNIFEIPPAKIKSNIYNVNDETEEVLGLFSAYSSDTLRVFVPFGDVGAPRPFCQPFPPPPAECFNCLLKENSTNIKPDYWQ